jgi:ribosomal protein S18 acetylase RimI-like enzyme
LVPSENLILSCSQSDTPKSFTKMFCYQSWRISASSVRHRDHFHLSQCRRSRRLMWSHLVYFNDVPVGTICCRLETKDGQTKLYLMTMGVLAVSTLPLPHVFTAESNAPKPYRDRRLGSQSLELIFGAASSHKKLKISHIYLHVQTSNGSAKRFYERHGFQEVG